MSAIGSFLPQLINRLPGWLINLAAIILLLLFAVLSLAPRMITGTIMCTTFEGERCSKLSINGNFDGRDVRTSVIDGTGTFYIPIYSPISSQQVSFYLIKKDVEIRVTYPMTFEMFPVWAGKQFNINLIESAPGKFEKPAVELVGGNWLSTVNDLFVAVAGELSPKANAAELMTYEQLLSVEEHGRETLSGNQKLPGDTLSQQQIAIIDKAVTDAVDKTAAESRTMKSPNSSLLQFSVDDMAKVNAILKADTGTSIPPQHWQYIKSKSDAIDYLKSLKGFEQKYPDIFKNDAQDWSNIEQNFQAKTGQTLVLVPKL